MSAETDPHAGARRAMVTEQLERRGILDQRVLRAMGEVPRHEFVPDEFTGRAYDDCPLPIGHDQTISQPYIVALMSELLQLKGDERVLEVGAGCGYQSAILGRLAGEVCALELEPELATRAQETLRRLGVTNVDLRQGDGFAPWPEGGQFERILCACAPGAVPEALLSQLAPGGLLATPVGPAGGVQQLQVWTRHADGSFTQKDAGGVRFVPMRHPRSLS